jgi:hypothetical protein
MFQKTMFLLHQQFWEDILYINYLANMVFSTQCFGVLVLQKFNLERFVTSHVFYWFEEKNTLLSLLFWRKMNDFFCHAQYGA